MRYNPELKVLGIVTGEGKSHAAASIMGLGMDPRFASIANCHEELTAAKEQAVELDPDAYA